MLQLTLTNNENVRLLGGKNTTQRILDMDNLETANVALAVNDETNTANVTTTSSHSNVTDLELAEVHDLVGLNVETNSVVGLDQRIGVADGTTVMGHGIGNTLLADQHLLDTAQLVLCLLIGNAVDGEATFNVIDETEVLASLFNGNDICQAKSRKSREKMHPGFVKAIAIRHTP